MASVGEPLNPEAVVWGLEAFGLPFHDNWWQTETGGIMIANYAAMDIKPGSMGKPCPASRRPSCAAWRAGGVEPVDRARRRWRAGAAGALAVDDARLPGRGGALPPSVLSTAGTSPATWRRRDADGYYWFVGRADDVIKSAGHLIGPFEVESALMEHPAVAEAGVIGMPDPTVGEMVKAFVALKPGFEPSEALRRELLGHARKRLGAAVAPKEIDFRSNLPKTRSGKIMRRLLKARELGLPEGDLSTLESDGRTAP